jgi:hypothetical protein
MLSSAESVFSFPELIHLFFVAFPRVLLREFYLGSFDCGFVLDNIKVITS